MIKLEFNSVIRLHIIKDLAAECNARSECDILTFIDAHDTLIFLFNLSNWYNYVIV